MQDAARQVHCREGSAALRERMAYVLDSLDVVIPTPLGVKRGRLGGPVGATGTTEMAIVLLDESGAHPLVERIFVELSSYLQAAGAVAVRMASPEQRGDPLGRLCALIGAVAAAGSLGPRRVAVVLAAPASGGSPAVPGAKPANLALAGLVGLAAARSQTGAQLALSLAGLTGAVRAAADNVVATATLMVPDTIVRTRHAAWGAAPDFAGLSAAPHRIVALPRHGASERQTVALISELYIWALRAGKGTACAGNGGALLQERAVPGRDGGGEHPHSAAAEPAASGLLVELEERWQAVVEALALRDPERAVRVRRVGMMASNPATLPALRASRAAWRVLDVPARVEWLRACSQAFRNRGMLGRLNAADVPTTALA